MSANLIWSSRDDEMLIDFVRINESLYNVKSKDYRKAQLKQNLWNNIGDILEKSGTDCFKRWAYVRDYYIRRRGKSGISAGGEVAKRRSDLLSFLDNIPSSQKNTISNMIGEELPDSEITEDTQADIEENISYIDETENMTRFNCKELRHSNNDKGNISKGEFMREKKKIKLTHSEERLRLMKKIVKRTATPAQNELDETDHFFKYIAKIVKKLPRYDQIQLRMQIGSLVGNAELRSISNISNETRQTKDSSRQSSTPSSTDSS